MPADPDFARAVPAPSTCPPPAVPPVGYGWTATLIAPPRRSSNVASASGNRIGDLGAAAVELLLSLVAGRAGECPGVAPRA